MVVFSKNYTLNVFDMTNLIFRKTRTQDNVFNYL